MVYIHSWQEFQDAAEALYTKSPNTTRYCIKWKSSEGKLVLKITDNTSCLKFKTSSSIFLNRFEALNLALMHKMQNHKRRPSASTATATASAVPAPASASVSSPAAAAAAASSLSVTADAQHDHAGPERGASPAPGGLPTAGVAGGGVKKKKPKKKK